MKLGWTAASALTLLAAWGGCVVDGFELGDAPAGAGGMAAGGGSNTSTGGTGGTACGSKQWPSPPAAADPSVGDVEVIVALRSVDFGETDLVGGPKVGFDLDGRCSCADDGQSCTSSEPAKQSCDGPMGIDNGIAELFGAAAVFENNFTSSYHANRANAGAWSILVRIRGYNGAANDDQIEVAMFPSGGLDEDPCHDGSPPSWDGSDAWPVMSTALEGPTGGGGGAGGAVNCGDPGPPGYSLEQPKYLDAGAYVTNHVMVASLPQAGIVLSSDGAGIHLVGGFLTGRLEQMDGAWHLRDGTLAGRWPTANLFTTMSQLGSDGQPLCTDDSTYQLIRDAVCGKRDITAQISGPTAPCDAVSFGMAFDAEPAQLGIIYLGDEGVGGGCPEETDPKNDSCQ
jgi:hypothetical protein